MQGAKWFRHSSASGQNLTHRFGVEAGESAVWLVATSGNFRPVSSTSHRNTLCSLSAGVSKSRVFGALIKLQSDGVELILRDEG